MTRTRHFNDENVPKVTNTCNGTELALQDVSGPTTPLPDIMLLLLILDKLQKKDTRGVFAEPVDPIELPDYHEVIDNPMDFDAVRKKLDQAVYLSLEQIEADIYLICSNAMQYNPPHTIYFRQARSIQELAKEFNIFRKGVCLDDTQPKVVRRGRPPKKHVDTLPVDCMGLKSSLDASLAAAGDSGRPNTYNLRKGSTSHRYCPLDGLSRTSYGSQNSDMCYEFKVPALKAMSSKPRKQLFVSDESRRDTYHQSFLLASSYDPSTLSFAQGHRMQLTVVGLQVDHRYYRSLARFSANLGPVVWKIASRKMRSVLHPVVESSPGWVEEIEPLLRLQQPVGCEMHESPEGLMSVSYDSHPPNLSTLGSPCLGTFDKSLTHLHNEEVVVAGGSSSVHEFSSLQGIALQRLQPSLSPGINEIIGQ